MRARLPFTAKGAASLLMMRGSSASWADAAWWATLAGTALLVPPSFSPRLHARRSASQTRCTARRASAAAAVDLSGDVALSASRS